MLSRPPRSQVRLKICTTETHENSKNRPLWATPQHGRGRAIKNPSSETDYRKYSGRLDLTRLYFTTPCSHFHTLCAALYYIWRYYSYTFLMLYYTRLYFTVLYCAVLQHTLLTTLFHTALYYDILYSTIRTILHHAYTFHTREGNNDPRLREQ